MAQIGPAGTAALAAHLSTTAAHVRYWYGLASAARLVEAFAGPDGRWLYRLTAAGRVLARNLAQQGELAGPKPILPGMVAGLLILAAGLVVVTSAAGPSPPRGFTRPGGAGPVAAGAILMQTDPGPGTRKLPPAPVRSSSLRSTSRPASPAGSASIFDLRSAISELPMMTEADRGPASTSSSMPTHAGGLSAGIAGDAEARRARAVEANPKAETRNSNFEPRSPNSELRSSNFDPRSSKPVIYRMLVTAYCPCGRCCGRWAGVPLPQRRTASGARLEPLLASGGCFAAAPPEIPFGTILRIPGYAGGRPVPVLDRGGDIHGDRLDVFFPTHRQALAWGRRVLDVEVLP
jgi:3D (Asp-Asp-Asp) domain-containing protein